MNADPDASRTPEMLVPRLGEYLVQRGGISEQDLQKALDHQRSACEPHPLLGEVLISLGLIDRRRLDDAITEMILQLRSALEESNRLLEQRVQQRTAELRQALKQLSELTQLKANFIANISHELRTPLTHIKGYLELISSGSLGPLNEEQKKALEVGQRSGNRLESLIDNLILFSQAEHGEMNLRLAPVDLHPVADRIAGFSRQKAADRSVRFDLLIPAAVPPVKVDEEKIAWVMLQLLDNAIKFTSAGGRVALQISVDRGNLLIAVSDTGIGIPSERIPELFVPFHQLDGSTTRRYAGTGLGLALVRQILLAHGTEIQVESEAGQGTRMSFRLPLAGREPSGNV